MRRRLIDGSPGDATLLHMISAWVVIPTYDEAENLVPLVRGVRRALPEAQVLVVDDASPDGTGEVADALARRDRAVAVLHRPGKAGLGRAYAAGFAHALAAGAGVVIQMDADPAGRSKMSPAIAREAVWRIPALRAGRRPASRPYRSLRRPAPVG